MTERFLLENNQAASNVEAAFILDQKKGLRVRILAFRTLLQLDAYEPTGIALRVRSLPILLEAMPSELSEKDVKGILNRMEHWYYYQQIKTSKIKPPPAGNPPVSGSADSPPHSG